MPEQARRHVGRLDRLAALTSFKAVLLEGLEVVFIVIAVSAGSGLLVPASAGALAACLLVACAGLVAHRPLTRVPENTLKFAPYHSFPSDQRFEHCVVPDDPAHVFMVDHD